MEPSPTATTVAVDPRHVSYAHVMYALHAASIVIAVIGTAVVVKAFLFSAPGIIAIIMNYARRARVRGTWLDSHFRWQRYTFWMAFIALVAARLAFGLLLLIGFGGPLLFCYLLIGLWVTWRTARGWLALRNDRSAPNSYF